VSQRKFATYTEAWPLTKPFTISRGTKTVANVLVVEITEDGYTGRGEGVPYAHYGETTEGVLAKVALSKNAIEDGVSKETILSVFEPGAGRNALDSALWDLEAKLIGRPVWEYLGLQKPAPIITAQTISIGKASTMASQAKELISAPLIKVKLDAEDVVSRVTAVREAAPGSRLIVDANEAWDMSLLAEVAPILDKLGVEMIEQPISSKEDAVLANYKSPVPLCADEGCHTCEDITKARERYDMINIKLDKTGGLTEALQLAYSAKRVGLEIMIGCMVGTSLAMAPAMMLASFAEFVDLDGPLLLQEDRKNGLVFKDGYVYPPLSALWG
tara:strand:+ start:2893 stop:3879 length:987 start_codon:yes stop_codon:yes gene_type:complete